MKSIFKFGATAAILAAGVALFALRPDASTAHYVLTNDNLVNQANTTTILRLGGTQRNPSLAPIQTLQTGQITDGGNESSPMIKIVHSGSDYCVYVADEEKSGNSISAFSYPGLQLVGNYSNPNVSNSAAGIGLATSGDNLFADYTGSGLTYGYVASWKIGPGCALSLLDTVSTAPQWPGAIAVTPDGRTVIIGYLSDEAEADSFSVSANGQLTELGPFGGFAAPGMLGMDLTADGKYVLFSIPADGDNGDDNTELESFAVNPGGTLTNQSIWGGGGGLGLGPSDAGYLWLSPDERFLYVASSSSKGYVTTLNFSESPELSISYACITTLRVPKGEPGLFTSYRYRRRMPSG